MQKIIFLGTDLHGEPSELAAKLVNDLSKEIKNSKKLSIQHRKILRFQEKTIIIPKILRNEYLRKLIQGILLPVYLIFLRLRYNKLFSFWTVGGKYGKYHRRILRLLKLLGYETIFTVISGYDRDYSALKFCDKIICQSEKMKKHLSENISNKDIMVIYPWTDLKIFKPLKKKNTLLIPSIPYKTKDFKERGIDKIIKILKNEEIKSKIIFRSNESHAFFKSLNLKNSFFINKFLNDKELSKIMGISKIIPLIYPSNAPDMPLSAIEGMACGCAIICTKDMGLADIIKKEKCGIIVNSEKDLIKAIKKILKSPKYYYKNARKTSEKYFDKNNNIEKYMQLIK